MRCLQRTVAFYIAVSVLVTAVRVHAINIVIDYSYDSTNFFSYGNPDGSAAGDQAKQTLEFAAGFLSSILTDTFSSIETPDPLISTVGTGVWNWSWSLTFDHPATGNNFSLIDQSIAPDEFRIYAGGRNFTGNSLGAGGSGGFGWSSTPTGTFSQAEINQGNQTTTDFSNAVETRGETSGFSRWGGSVSFDNSGTNWHYDHQTLPASGQNDFLSVALHELVHVVGLGTSDDWNSLIIGQSFTGSAAVAEYGGYVPLECGFNNCGHWVEGTQSEILATTTPQEVLLDPTLSTGKRERLTKLEGAALTDIGWSVSPPSVSVADYDGDGDVDGVDLDYFTNWYSINAHADNDGDNDTDGADFLRLQRFYTGVGSSAASTTVPEPGTATLLGLVLLGIGSYAASRGRR